MTLSFFVPGIPVPQGSQRSFIIRPKYGKPRAGLVEDAKGLKPWRAQVAYFAQQAMRDANAPGWFSREPLVLAVTFRLPRPTALPRRITQHVRKPDLSKMVRAVEDALTAVVWGDDAQIVRHETEKVYDGRAGAQIEVRSVEP